MGTTPEKPELHAPVVVDGVKYRVKSIDTGAQTGWRPRANLRQHFAPHAETTAFLHELVWDAVAGVWRIAA